MISVINYFGLREFRAKPFYNDRFRDTSALVFLSVLNASQLSISQMGFYDIAVLSGTVLRDWKSYILSPYTAYTAAYVYLTEIWKLYKIIPYVRNKICLVLWPRKYKIRGKGILHNDTKTNEKHVV